MTIKPVLLTPPDIRAVRDGRKTMMRLPLPGQPVAHSRAEPGALVMLGGELNRVSESRGRNKSAMGLLNAKTVSAPYQIDDVLWLRERWRPLFDGSDWLVEYGAGGVFYPDDLLIRAEIAASCAPDGWKSPLRMPMSFCRLWLKIESCSLQQVRSITCVDAADEGIVRVTKDSVVYKYCAYGSDGAGGGECPWSEMKGNPVAAFGDRWGRLNGRASWLRNDWVWAYRFSVLTDVDVRSLRLAMEASRV